MKRLLFNIMLYASSIFSIIACEGTFIPDPIDPRLPKYTENGHNVAGAFINNTIWRSKVSIGFPHIADNKPFIILFQDSDSLVICFSGNTNIDARAISFHMSNLGISKFEDLSFLNGKKIQLDGVNNVGYCDKWYSSLFILDKGIGQIYFRNVSLNSTSTGIIISGTFGFSTNAITVSHGRFDYRINKDSNFQIE